MTSGQGHGDGDGDGEGEGERPGWTAPDGPSPPWNGPSTEGTASTTAAGDPQPSFPPPWTPPPPSGQGEWGQTQGGASSPSFPAQGGYGGDPGGGYQQPPGGWQTPGQPWAPPGYGTAPAWGASGYGATPAYGQKTSGLAIASLVCALISVPFGSFIVPNALGLIFGLVSRSQIRRSNGAERGGGMALAGIIISAITLVGWIIFWIAVAVAASHSNDTNPYYYTPTSMAPLLFHGRLH